MSLSPEKDQCERADLVAPYALEVLSGGQAELMKAHLPTCIECQRDFEALTPVTGALTAWRAHTLLPPLPLWGRLVERIASRTQDRAVAPPASNSSMVPNWPEPQWKEVAPGITCKLLSTDVAMDRVAMLVRLAQGVSYPAHQHASVEELYLLEGELWIDDRSLSPGDYNRAEPGTMDQRVWTSTGCMCLLITSPSDQLR